MKNSRPRIKFSQTPHSISRRIEKIPNKTASALLSLLTRKTVGFGVGFVDLPYRQISEELDVGARAIQNAAKLLEQWGDIVRERVACRIYRWRVVLEQDEIIEDPRRTYTTKAKSEEQVRNQRSGPCRQKDPDHEEPTIRTSTPHPEQMNALNNGIHLSPIEQNPECLKNSFKERDLKKQQHLQPNEAPCDDEPFHKLCLKGLREHGVSQRMARKLCREHSHRLILSVLKAAPKRPGIQNLPAYIVSEIQDGGYEQTSSPETIPRTHPIPKRDNLPYEGVQDKTSINAPITYRTVEQTRTEQKNLAAQKLEEEQQYQKESKKLAQRFKGLPEDIQLRLKLIASVHLSELVPISTKREEMLRDKTFQRMANRNVLERFFTCLDSDLEPEQALQCLETASMAA